MHLGTWLASQPRGAKQRLARLANRSPRTITEIAQGERLPTYKNARRISAATNGEVTIADLLPQLHLGDWLAQQPRGAKQQLVRATGLWANTITDIASRKRTPSYETARLISDATGGEVTIAELLRSVTLTELEMRTRELRRKQRRQEVEEQAS